MTREADDTEVLVGRVAAGDGRWLGELFERHRGRLEQMVRLRLDRRLQGRLDPADVLQEAYLDVARRFPEYAARRDMPFYLWLRLLTGQKLAELHRRHLGAKCATPAWRCRCAGARCPGPRRRRWPNCSWAG
jgi:RNA polymerase sigma-70 factor (ECF subfamily)